MSTTHPLPALFGRVTAIASDHAHLEAMIRPLEAWARDAASGVRSRVRDELELSLLQLHAAMARHFAAEESERYFGSVVAEQPAVGARVERLVVEHAAMLRQVRSLIDDRDRIELHDFAERLLSFVETFAAHEAAESDLIRIYLQTE